MCIVSTMPAAQYAANARGDGSSCTMEQIAKVLRVSKKTISLDLSDCYQGNNQNHASTATNPRGSGRKKGSKNSAAAKKPRRDNPDRNAPTNSICIVST